MRHPLGGCCAVLHAGWLACCQLCKRARSCGLPTAAQTRQLATEWTQRAERPWGCRAAALNLRGFAASALIRCVSTRAGWGLKPVNQGDPGLIGCVRCSSNGVDNCQKCCIPNGSHFCGEAYLSYGCCDWCTDEGFDNPPTHGVCYTTGTSPQVANPTDGRDGASAVAARANGQESG